MELGYKDSKPLRLYCSPDMEKISDVHHYNQETTRKGSMKIEVVVEEAKKPKRDRPGSASSIRNIEDIQKRQKVPMIMFQYLFYLSSTYIVKLLFKEMINLQTAIRASANKEGHSILELFVIFPLLLSGCRGEKKTEGVSSDGQPRGETEKS